MLSELLNTGQNWSYHLIKCWWYAWNVVLEAVLFAFNSVSVSQMSSITAARKHWWNQNCMLTAKRGVKIERERQTITNGQPLCCSVDAHFSLTGHCTDTFHHGKRNCSAMWITLPETAYWKEEGSIIVKLIRKLEQNGKFQLDRTVTALKWSMLNPCVANSFFFGRVLMLTVYRHNAFTAPV